jgi:hypothetical protein
MRGEVPVALALKIHFHRTAQYRVPGNAARIITSESASLRNIRHRLQPVFRGFWKPETVHPCLLEHPAL